MKKFRRVGGPGLQHHGKPFEIVVGRVTSRGAASGVESDETRFSANAAYSSGVVNVATDGSGNASFSTTLTATVRASFWSVASRMQPMPPRAISRPR